MKWTDKAWLSIEPIFDDILKMAFIQELQEGTLPLAKFQFYMLQDAKYLEHFARVLAYLGSKLPDNEQALAFFEFGKNALIVERALHGTYFKQFGLSDGESTALEPVCHHYVHLLKSTAAFDPIEVGVAAVLPCFWIYKEVGDFIYRRQTKSDNPYASWIETYSSEEFAQSLEAAKGYADTLASQASPAIQQHMIDAFVRASQLEYLFWEAAYTQKVW